MKTNFVYKNDTKKYKQFWYFFKIINDTLREENIYENFFLAKLGASASI